MERITHRLILDVNKGGIQRVVQGIETGDSHAREIRITLANGKEAIEMPQNGDGMTAVMYVMKPSSTSPSVNDCSFDGDDIVYVVKDSDITEAGRVSMQLKLITTNGDNEQLVFVSPRFALEVWESDVDDSEASSSAVFTALEVALDNARTAYNTSIGSIVIDDDNMFIVTYKDGSTYESTVIQDALAQLSDIDEYVERAETAATSADASKVAAAASATSASTYEAAALASKNAAALSAESASASESRVAASELAAKASENAAKASEDNASASASSALNYKNSAISSAASASTSAEQASSSKDAAATSASNASESATSAATSAASVLANSKVAESYAKGGTGTRAGEDYDNAKYYMEQAKAVVAVDIATTTKAGIVKPDGNTISVMPDGTISAQKIAIDDALSDTSENPVQNKVVKAAINAATPEGYDTVKAQVQTNTGNISTLTSDVSDLKTDKADDSVVYKKANDVFLTMAEYEALPSTKLTDGKHYYITDGEGEIIEAVNVPYDNATSALSATNAQGAIDELADVSNVLGDEDAYNSVKVYSVGDMCIYQRKLYKCLVSCTGIVPTNESYWEQVSLSNVQTELKLLGVVDSTETLTLPDFYTEIIGEISFVYNSNFMCFPFRAFKYTIDNYLSRSDITGYLSVFCAYYYPGQSMGTIVNINKSKQMWLEYAHREGDSYKSSAKLIVYYR